MRRWFNTLFARLLLMQLAVIMVILALLWGWGGREQGTHLARLESSIWASALQMKGHQSGAVEVLSTVTLLQGPPPPDAWSGAYLWRYRALPEELGRLGVTVHDVKISGRFIDAVTWLEVEQADGVMRWVGVRSPLGGRDLRESVQLAVAVVMTLVLGLALWLARWVVRPVDQLRESMRRFEVDGVMPQAAADKAPAELRELAQEFIELARLRSDVNEQRRTMLAGISHDLRSPLARIRMAAELLPEIEGVAERQAAIARNVRLSDRLLGSFIDFARAEDEPVAGRVDLCALLRDLVQGEADVTVLELPPSPRWLAPASAVALERAMRNLLDNARHHGAGPICLALHTDAFQSVLSVRDHGTGIPPAARHAMLQPFFRGESSRNQPGTGLGLAIVQRTAVRHGGSVVLLGADPGLRVELRLPACENDNLAF